jgi:hypothetical protein
MELSDKDRCRIIVPEFRVAFPALFKPSAMPGAKPKYAVTMLYSKDYDIIGVCPKTKKPRTLKQVIRNAKTVAFGENKKKWPKGLVSPVNDGDVPNKKGEIPEGFAGHWAIKATSSEDRPPKVLGPDKEPLEKASDIPPGCYARAILFCRVWEFGGTQGVQFILDGIQKSDRKFKSFGGRKNAEDVFEPWTVEEDSDDTEDDENDDGGDF